MEKARTERVDNQVEDRVPAARTANRSDRKTRAVKAAVRVPAKVKVGEAVVDRDRAAARDEVAVKIVDFILMKEDIIMPGLDRSGPMGAGPMSGGRRGTCGRAGAAANRPVYGGGFGYGRGMGFRRGYGRGRGTGFGPAHGDMFYPPAVGQGYPASRTDEVEMLKADADAMQKSLEAVQQRIAQLEKEGSE